ncbi:DUF4244 domain-containing protein [Streptomyces sp. p1417]|uniref:DUF4244 domain-containing protein n=1 Tax=Streptomyces typhae TaxID=2681492 RepID=A0A6L6WYQ2_9ACTN|nr:DUF4244 domain-containing protein [Streptomyces typhae]
MRFDVGIGTGAGAWRRRRVRESARRYVARLARWLRWERRPARASGAGPGPWTTRRRHGLARDSGMVTSEYAMGIIATVAFAGLLFKVVTSGPVKSALQAVVAGALDAQF